MYRAAARHLCLYLYNPRAHPFGERPHLVKVACTIHLPMHPRVYRSVQVPEGSVSLNVPCLAAIFTRNTLRLPANSACSPWLRPAPGFSPKHTDSESLASPVQSIRTAGCRPRCSARAEGLVRFCSPSRRASVRGLGCCCTAQARSTPDIARTS